MRSSGFRVLLVREGISYIKGRFSLLLLFSIPSPLTSQFLAPFYTSSINMASYAEDILHAACEASSPSLRDIEVIRSFQSCPATKDTVSVSLISFNNSLLILSCFSLEWDAHLLGSQGY
jgi:hypothetical protein